MTFRRVHCYTNLNADNDDALVGRGATTGFRVAEVAHTFVRNAARMRAGFWSLSLAIAVFAVATIAWLNPYNVAIHQWEATLAVALVALYLLVQSARSLAKSRGQEGFTALGGLGGVVLAIAFVAAELLVGPPQRIGAAPGQTYRPPHSAQLALEFPPVNAADLRGGNSP